MTKPDDTTTAAGGSPLERGVGPAVAEALRLATQMMRDSWATGGDAAWQPGYRALEAHLLASTAPPIDYEALIKACFERTKQAQGTRGCVQFAKGAEWFREQVLRA